MASEISNFSMESQELEEDLKTSPIALNPSLRYLKLIKFVKDEYPDCPQKSEVMSFENFHEAVKEYLKIKGLKDHADFSDVDKEAIVEDCIIHFIDLKVLSQKYNTMTCIIKSFVQEAGLRLPRVTTPDDLLKYPDYPKKSDEMSKEEYYKIIKKYWNTKRREKYNEKKQAARELKVQEILETMNPEDLTDHPNFPEYSEGTTDLVYAEKIENYWQNRKKLELKKRKLMPVQPDQLVQGPKWIKKRKLADFDLEEQKVIYNKRIHRSIKLELVAKQHDTFVEVINEIISRQLEEV